MNLLYEWTDTNDNAVNDLVLQFKHKSPENKQTCSWEDRRYNSTQFLNNLNNQYNICPVNNGWIIQQGENDSKFQLFDYKMLLNLEQFLTIQMIRFMIQIDYNASSWIYTL